MPDYYTVELRIYGETLDFDEISRKLGLVPTTLQKKGQHAYSNKTFKKSMWGYAQLEGKGLREWSSLEDGITRLLEELLTLNARIKEFQPQNKIVLWCGHFQQNFGSGPTLTAKSIKLIADIGADITLSTYFSDGTD